MKKNHFILSLSFFALGLLYFMHNQGWLIVRFPSYKTEIQQIANGLRTHKKRVRLIFWHNKKWYTEQVDILQTEDNAQTVQHLINSWLTLLDEETIMGKKVTLQSALISPNGLLYLSFDRNPFNEKNSTHTKWMWVEGLLKTMRENNISLQNIRFLVHHQTMQDGHLDFSNPWPIAGFLPQ